MGGGNDVVDVSEGATRSMLRNWLSQEISRNYGDLKVSEKKFATQKINLTSKCLDQWKLKLRLVCANYFTIEC